MIEAKKLSKIYPLGKKLLKAVDQVNFSIKAGETLGLVGESGCGKSTLGRALIHLEKPSSGEVFYNGEKVTKLMPKRMQLIFQDPFASLNPRMTVRDIIGEPLIIHRLGKPEKRVLQLLDLVGLPESAKSRFPHEFSGGQRQRIGIARALALEPEFIVCDEPISALDVSIQAQIVNLLIELQKQFNLTYLFIAHDLAMVKYISTHVAVMYLGGFVETAPAELLYQNPLHPYTQILFNSIHVPDPKKEKAKKFIPLSGEIPSPLNPQKGCPFSSRCPKVLPICREVKPQLLQIGPGHEVACHLYT